MSSDDEHNIMDSAPEDEEKERTAIREQLSSLSFEELQKLKEKIGSKVYKEALFGKNGNIKEQQVFKRENKNRPREMSSKKPVRIQRNTVRVKEERNEIRDPRFDPLCGEFDKKLFNVNYNFLSDMRFEDIKAVKAELKETTDPQRQIQLRRLLQRLNNQQRASRQKKLDEKKLNEKKSNESKEKLPYKRKSEQRLEGLITQYEELKEKGIGKLHRHIKHRQQKIKKKSHHAPIGGT